MKRIRAVILGNESPDEHIPWIKACENHKDEIEYRIVNLTSFSWFEDISEFPFDVLLAKPGGLTAIFKELYDERIMILASLGYHIFPCPDEIFIYENKRYLSYWLKAKKIPSPGTYVFYNQKEAFNFINNASMPVVAKTNIGASGSGVKIIHDQKEGIKYISKTFSVNGIKRRAGPNLQKKGYFRRAMNCLTNPSKFLKRIESYTAIAADPQRNFVLFQDFIPHDFEWRVVRIGESFFAHKKLKIGEKSSGTSLKNYDNPPLMLFDFVKDITDRVNFFSQSVDIFESKNGYLINEMQCIFGQSDSYQMLVDGKPGRYIYNEGRWVFEEGNFAKNACYDLRIKFIIERFRLASTRR